MLTNVTNKLLTLGDWRSINLKNFNDCYFIAIKENIKKVKEITINSKDIKKIRFELAIDCGIAGKPLTMQHFSLDFSDTTSSDNEINKITAFTRLVNIPNEFYIKAVSVEMLDGTELTEGTAGLSINVNALNLG